MEPDPVTRRLVELYLAPLGYTVRWVESLEGWPGPHAGALAFLLSANAIPDGDAAGVADIAQKVTQQLGAIPVLGMAGDRHRFPPQTLLHPIRHFLRKPIRARELMSVLEAIQSPPPVSESPSPLDGFGAMAQEFGMDGAMIADLCHSFIERGEKYLLAARDAAEPRNDAELDRIAHAFKGMAGNMRLLRMTELSEALRRAAKDHAGDVLAAIRSLQVEFGAVRKLLHERWLKDRPVETGG
jgi:CheY-like chemotaxis protein